MSKTTNDNLSRSDTGCIIAAPIWQQWRHRVKAVENYLSLTATTGLDEAAADEVDTAEDGRAIDPRVASIAFWIASDGCCVVLALAA